MNFICIIPSRYGSTRFPGKPLADIFGKTMIQRVYEQARKIFDYVLVATDDIRISKEVENFGGLVIMTSENHNSGTDRCKEALNKFEEKSGKKFDITINIQGDEPFIKPEQLIMLKNCFNDSDTQIATLIKKISSQAEYLNPNKPKVIFNKNNEAIYFSRAGIPYIREKTFEQAKKENTFYKHIGVYAYKSEILRKLTELEQSGLELTEKLEQNRWVENGFKIKVAITEYESLSVDTPEDLDKIIKLTKNFVDFV